MDPSKFQELIGQPGNNVCAECGAKDPRWASWNIGILICVRCSGIHRSLGTHVSKVKSLTLDTWTDEQYQTLAEMGNNKAADIYLKNLTREDPRPNATSDASMQHWIKAKYERKQFMDDPSRRRGDDFQAPDYMDILVSEPETSEEGGHKFTTYLITVTTNIKEFSSRHFSLRKRYSEFRELYAALQSLTKGKPTKLPAFPPRTFFKAGEDRFSTKIVDQRKADFEKLLQQVSLDPELRRAPIFVQFLTEVTPRS